MRVSTTPGPLPLTCLGETLGRVSDSRLVHSVQEIDNALGKVLRLNGVEYNMNASLLPETQGRRDMGFVAQEVEAIEPLLVGRPTSGDMQMYLHVDYAKTAPLLVEATKQMHAAFEAQLFELKHQLHDLEESQNAQSNKQSAAISELR